MPVGRPKGLPHTGGRKPGTPNHVTNEVRELARVHGPMVIERLAYIAQNGEHGVSVQAARELLDRGYGKAPQPHDGDGQGGPIKGQILVYSGVLAEADQRA